MTFIRWVCDVMDLKEIEILYSNLSASFELRHEKTGFFHMRNQSRRSASR